MKKNFLSLSLIAVVSIVATNKVAAQNKKQLDSAKAVAAVDQGHLDATLKVIRSKGGVTKPLIAAHRGEHNNLPENSLAAFKQTIQQGTDILELDVRVSKDGVPFIMHDATLDRTTNGTGDPAQLTMQQLKSFYLKTAPGKGLSEERIPTLEEVFKFCKKKILIDLDIKTDELKPLVALVKKYEMANNVLFFDDETTTMDYVKANVAGAMLMPRAHSKTQAMELLTKYHPAVVHIDDGFVSKEVIDLIHAGNAKVWINALDKIDDELVQSLNNSSSTLQQFMNLGCDILQTNLPQRLKEATK